MKQWGILLGVMVLFLGSARAQRIFEVNDALIERNFMPYELEYYVDTTNAISFWQISSNSFSNRFHSHPTYHNKDFKPNASYWIRLPIQHRAGTAKVWLLEFYDQTIDEIEAYIPQENGSYKNVMLGDSQPFAQRLVPLVLTDTSGFCALWATSDMPALRTSFLVRNGRWCRSRGNSMRETSSPSSRKRAR